MRFLILIFALCASVCLHAQTQRAFWADGKWEGTAYQLDYGTWTVSLHIDHEAGKYEIKYPSLDCGGKWTFEKNEEGTLWFRENLTYGLDQCVQYVNVSLTRIDENYITFTCFRPGSWELSSFATLKRKK